MSEQPAAADGVDAATQPLGEEIEMSQSKPQLRETLIATGLPLEDLQLRLDGLMEELVNKGQIVVRDLKHLGGRPLEFYVRTRLQQIGFTVQRDPRVEVDAVVSFPSAGKSPIALEVKSGKALGPTRDNLRQLDDWVYELSGEEMARKGELGKGIELDYVHTIPLGGGIRLRHRGIRLPNYHKGLFIYNCAAGTHFDMEPNTPWLGHNELQFAQKRDFCVVSFRKFLELAKSVNDGVLPVETLYVEVLATSGELAELHS